MLLEVIFRVYGYTCILAIRKNSNEYSSGIVKIEIELLFLFILLAQEVEQIAGRNRYCISMISLLNRLIDWNQIT